MPALFPVLPRKWGSWFTVVALAGVISVLSSGMLEAQDASGEPSDAKRTATTGEVESDANAISGRVLRIGLPITGPVTARIKQHVGDLVQQAADRDEQLVFILEFEVPPDEEEYAIRSEFGACYDLAEFLTGPAMAKHTTVAYIPQPVAGHAVLVALACDRIVMGPEGELGAAGIAESRISPPMVSAYRHMAQRRRTIPEEVAVGMLDPAKSVLIVETDTERRFVTPEQLERLRQERTIRGEPKVLFSENELGRLAAREARELDFIDALADDMTEVLRLLEIPPDRVEQIDLLGERWRPVLIEIKGPIRANAVDRAIRLVQDAIRRDDANFVCVRIDSPGGSPADSLRLATYLSQDLAADRVRTVAYIPSKALADAALIAAACDHVIMKEGAVLGGEGDVVLTDRDITSIVSTLKDVIVERTHRSWSLTAAMFDPNLEVVKYNRKGNANYVDYFCKEELASLPDTENWEPGEVVHPPGEVLQVEADRARELGLAREIVSGFAELRHLYGLDDDPTLLEPTWADVLIEALASPYVAVFLLIFGVVGLMIELQTPGVGVGGFLAATCFVLFFWSRFLGQTAGWLEVSLFVLGIVCLLLEFFVIPGFGIFGLGGGLLVLASLILAGQTFVIPRNSYQLQQFQNSLYVLAGAGIGIVAAIWALNKWLPGIPVLGRIVLQPPSKEEQEEFQQRRRLSTIDESWIGKRGKVTAALMPSGKARIDGRLIDVIAEDYESIDPPTEVEITEVRGNRVFVRPVRK